MLAALALVVAIAAVDEWRQRFVPGRSARVHDVGLDALGGAAGLLAARLAFRPRSQPR